MQNLDREIEAAGLAKNQKVKALLMMSQLTGDASAGGLLEIIKMRSAFAVEAHPFAPSPVELPPGDVYLGNVLLSNGDHGPPVAIPVDLMSAHTLITATSGAGKSTAIKIVVLQLMKLGVPVWLIDSEDEFLATLAQFAGRDNLLHFDLETYRRNPLEPLPGENPVQTIMRARDVFSESLWWGEGAKNEFTQVLMNLMAERGIFKGGTNYPTISDVARKMAKTRGRYSPRQADYRLSVLNRLVPLTELMPCYNCVSAGDFGIDKLLHSGKSVVFRIRSGVDVLNVFSKDLLKATSALLEREQTERPRLVVCLDESHRLVNTANQREYEPVLLDLAATFRKRGVGLILATQSPSLLPAQIAAVSNTRIAFRTVDGKSARTVADSMGLDRERMNHLLMLPARHAVIHYPLHPEPFVMEVPEAQFSSRGWVAHDWMPEILEGMKWVAPEEDEQEHEIAKEVAATGTEIDLLKEELDYLQEIAKAPLKHATKRDLDLGIPIARGTRLRSELEKKGYVTIERVTSGKRGGQPAIVELTPKALKLFEEMGIEAPDVRGRGSLGHKYYQWRVAKWFESKGWKAKIESESDGRADVVAEMGQTRIAIEIELSDRTAVRNAERDFEEFSDVWFVAPDETLLGIIERKVRSELDQEKNRRVQFSTFSDFVRNFDDRRDTPGSGGEVVKDPGETRGLGVERTRSGGNKETKKEDSNDGENGNEWLREQLAQTLRIIDDPLELEKLELAKLPAIERWSAAKFRGNVSWRGRGLQDLIWTAAEKVLENLPAEDGFTKFVKLYITGVSVAEAGRQAGVSREYASRVYRARLIDALTRVIENYIARRSVNKNDSEVAK